MDERQVRWINDEATALLAAERDRVPVASLTERRPGLALEDAYLVQAAAVARRIEGGARVIGHKAGVTSKAMQEQMRVDEPDSGVLLDNMVLPSGSSLVRSELMQPRVEAEIAFRLGRDLEAARSAVAGVFLALEVIDTRFTGWQITVADSIADNASCSRVVTSPMVPFDPDVDLAAESLVASVNGAAVAAGELQGHDAPGRRTSVGTSSVLL
ncbi:2-keto-4-pentenoate hydratase [Streptomyces sp. NPDC002596]